MKFFNFKKEDEVLDLTENYNSESPEENSMDFSGNLQERRKKFAKRIADMAEKLEELSTQIYHLTQRIEVLEKKTRVQSFE